MFPHSREAVERLGAAIDDAQGPALLARMIREEFPGRIALVSSFGIESAVLLHMTALIDSATPVIFLDTGKLFEQTLAYKEKLIGLLGLTNVITAAPQAAAIAEEDPSGMLHSTNPDACCDLRKSQPLTQALAPFDAWITGRKRYQGGARENLPVVEPLDGKIKINPLTLWTFEKIEDYFTQHNLPRHPLLAHGYSSVGCAPCTQKSAGACGARDGRWAGTPKSECGIHIGQDGRFRRVA